MGLGIVKLGQGQWAVKDGNLLAAKETNGRLKNAEFTVTRGTRATYVGRDGLIKESNLQDVNLVNNGDFSELGSELVTNGTFDTDSDWVKGSGWSIANGKASCNGSSTNLSQNGVLVVGKNYKITITVTDYVSGTVEVSAGASPRGTMSANGTYTFYQNATPTTNFYIVAQSFNGSVDNVSIQEVDPNDEWIEGTNWIIEDGKGVANNSSSYIKQNNLISNNKTFKIQFDTTVTSGQFRLVATADAATYTSYVTESGSYTFYMKPTVSINGGLEFVGSSFTGSIDNIVVKEVKTDTPRIDFTDNTDGHLLLEPQSTNLLTYSEDFTNWTKLNGGTGSLPVVTSNTTISPSGEQNADTIFFDKGAASGGGDYSLLRLDYGGADVDGTASIYLKADTNVDIEISSDDGIYQTVSVTNTWQRFSVSDATSDRLSMGLRGTAPSNNTATVYAWGAQLEALSYPTSYIPTNGSTVTRDADTCTGSGEAVDFNSEEGVLYAEIAATSISGGRWLSLSDGTTNERLSFAFQSSDIRLYIKNSSGLIWDYTTSGINILNYNKIALKYKSGDYALWVNGVEVSTNTNSNLPNNLSSLQFDSSAGGASFYGKCKAIRVYKEALSDTDLQNLTS